MGQQALGMKIMLKQLRHNRSRKPEDGSRTPAPEPVGVAPTFIPFLNTSLSLIVEKKRTKRNERSGKSSKSHKKSPKRGRPNFEVVCNLLASTLMGNNFKLDKEITFSLTPSEKGSMASTFTADLVSTCLEFQSRALMLGRVIGDEPSQASSTKVEKLKQELADSSIFLKATLETNYEFDERAQVADFDRESFACKLGVLKKTQHTLLEKENSSLQNDMSNLVADVKELEQSLVEIMHACEEVVRKIESTKA